MQFKTSTELFNYERQLASNREINEVARGTTTKGVRSPATYYLTFDQEVMKASKFFDPCLVLRRARRQHTPLHAAIIRSDLPAVIANLTEENIDLATVNGLTPLHLAVYALGIWQKAHEFMQAKKSVQEQIVEVLIEAGAPVDIWDSMNRLPAVCIDGGKLPLSLIHAMEQARERTTEGDGKLNVFFDKADAAGETFGMRGNQNNKSGRGGFGRASDGEASFYPADDELL